MTYAQKLKQKDRVRAKRARKVRDKAKRGRK